MTPGSSATPAVSPMADPPLVLCETHDDVLHLTLNRPTRHNALVPELIAELRTALAEARHVVPRALVLRGAGRSFSSGGDVAGFFETPRAQRVAYANTVVGGLHAAILELLALPCPTVAVVHGMVTGGALGLPLACDITLGTPRAHFAPWYTTVGFSPDGGWTTLVPARIGPARALAVQLLNQRITAEEAQQWGLLHTLVPEAGLEAALADVLARLRQTQPGSVQHTLARLRPDAAVVRAGLDAEFARFLAQIDTEEAEAGMAAFLGRPRQGAATC